MSVKGLTGGGDARTDAGWITSSTIAQAAAIAVVTLQMKTAKDIADAQMELAESYRDMYKRLQDYWFDVFQECEIATVQESCAEDEYEPDYDEQRNRFAASARLAFARAREEFGRCISRFCTGARDSAFYDLVIAEATAVTDSINYGYRHAEARAQALNDVRWGKRMQVLGLGRNIMSNQLAYAQAAGSAYSSLGQQATSAISGNLQALGYLNQRNRIPVQPYQQLQTTTPLTTAGSPTALFSSFGQSSNAITTGNSFFNNAATPANQNYSVSPGINTNSTGMGNFGSEFGGSYTQPSDGGFFTTNDAGVGG